MPTYTSPYASSFKSAVNRGTSYNVAVQNIAKRHGKSTDLVWNSLYKADLCYRQKFNGKWVYFPCDWHKKSTISTCRVAHTELWQCFCEWCLMNGFCTPDQMWNHTGSQKEFMTWCRKYFNKQFTGTGLGSTTKVRRARGTTYKFPMSKTRSRRRAA